MVVRGGNEGDRGHSSSMQRARRLGETSLTGIPNASSQLLTEQHAKMSENQHASDSFDTYSKIVLEILIWAFHWCLIEDCKGLFTLRVVMVMDVVYFLWFYFRESHHKC